MADYENITNPYDNTLARQPGGLSFAAGGQNIDSGVAQQSQAAAQAGGNTAASSSVGGGPAQQASVASGGAIADITIEHSIQSKNWSPKKVGFYIDGQTGYAEFSNVFVSGDIQALTGTIGGWTITSDALTAPSSGTVAIKAGQTAYDTGTGFWLGLDAGTAKLSMGVGGGGKGITWDGTVFALRTGSTGQRINLDSTDNFITLYDSVGQVIRIGTSASIGILINPNATTTTGFSVGSSVDGTIGVNLSSNADITFTALNISLTSATAGNDGPAIKISHSGTASTSYGIDIIKAGAGNPIKISNTGSGDSISITTSGNAARGMYIINSSTTGTVALVSLNQDSLGRILELIGTNSGATAANSLYVSHASAGVGAVQIDKTADGRGLGITMSGASAANQDAFYLDMSNTSTGRISLITAVANKSTGTYFADLGSSFYDVAAVGATQDRKIKILLGGTDYFIPCYTT